MTTWHLKYLNLIKIFAMWLSSVEAAFEFCWSSFADENYTLPKWTRREAKFEQICIWNPMTTGFITLTLIYIISMQFLLLSGRHSSAQNVLSSKEQGETAVFAGYWLSNVRRIQSTQIVYFIFSYDKRLYIYTFCLGITHTRVSFSHLKLLIFYPI